MSEHLDGDGTRPTETESNPPADSAPSDSQSCKPTAPAGPSSGSPQYDDERQTILANWAGFLWMMHVATGRIAEILRECHQKRRLPGFPSLEEDILADLGSLRRCERLLMRMESSSFPLKHFVGENSGWKGKIARQWLNTIIGADQESESAPDPDAKLGQAAETMVADPAYVETFAALTGYFKDAFVACVRAAFGGGDRDRTDCVHRALWGDQAGRPPISWSKARRDRWNRALDWIEPTRTDGQPRTAKTEPKTSPSRAAAGIETPPRDIPPQSLESRALGIAHETWAREGTVNVAGVARRLGVSRDKLYRCPNFCSLVRMSRQLNDDAKLRYPRGSKDRKTGTVEAFGECADEV
jgi:hypothetical protein